MRAYVFTDKSLTRQAGRFVWLSIDSEKSSNAALTKRLGVQALPTFFIVDPTDDHVALRWVGGATAAQLQKILDDALNLIAHCFRDAAVTLSFVGEAPRSNVTLKPMPNLPSSSAESCASR